MSLLDGWKSCPRCRAPLEPGQGSVSCTSCGSTYWANSAPAVEGLLVRDGSVLLSKRAIDPRRGYWDLPGGFLEEGEAPLDGLAREFREETGLVVRPLEWLGTHVEPYQHYFVLGMTWLVEADGDPRPADDVEELDWFGPAELPDEMAFPHQAELLRGWAARQQQS
jgi:ADP-ribose pyrophosphatase YjhB (NUDIX family)